MTTKKKSTETLFKEFVKDELPALILDVVHSEEDEYDPEQFELSTNNIRRIYPYGRKNVVEEAKQYAVNHASRATAKVVYVPVAIATVNSLQKI